MPRFFQTLSRFPRQFGWLVVGLPLILPPASAQELQGRDACIAKFLVATSTAAAPSPSVQRQQPCDDTSIPSAKLSIRQQKKERFDLLQDLCGAQIWKDELDSKTASALNDYRSRKTLPNGLEYGASVRDLNLHGKSVAEIDRRMRQGGCEKREDSIRAQATSEPVRDADGKPISLLIYLCPDGGVVRLKPKGDPGFKLRPQPNAVKYVRYPYNTPSHAFSEEAIKVDNEGLAIPKWPRDLAPLFPDDERLQNEIADGWAEDAHTDLKSTL